MINKGTKIALVDDDSNAADMLSVLLEDAGLEPVVVGGSLHDVDAASALIREISSAAICDHRLRPFGMANFSGAQLVSQLYTEGFPAVLISQYLPIDHDVSIRQYRERIPVLLSRKEADPERLVQGIDICRNELEGRFIPQRKAWRNLVRIVAKDFESGEDVVDAYIPGWRHDEAVRFPASFLGDFQHLLPEEPTDNLSLRFFAQVNVGAEEAHELFLTQFEVAPEPKDGSHA